MKRKREFLSGDSYSDSSDIDKPVPVNIYDGKLEIEFDGIKHWIETIKKKGKGSVKYENN